MDPAVVKETNPQTEEERGENYVPNNKESIADENRDKEEGNNNVVPQREVNSCHRDLLCKQVEQLVADINAKRARDTELIEGCKREMEVHVSSSIELLQSHVFKTYQETEKLFEPKLKEFGEVIQRIETLETELEEYKGNLRQLYEELMSPLAAEV